eukprot:5502768-Alexandrium_andersonii.AAC.1
MLGGRGVGVPACCAPGMWPVPACLPVRWPCPRQCRACRWARRRPGACREASRAAASTVPRRWMPL